MEPLKHIYPILNEEIISELSPTDVRISKLEIEVKHLKETVMELSKMVIMQTGINQKVSEILENLNKK